MRKSFTINAIAVALAAVGIWLLTIREQFYIQDSVEIKLGVYSYPFHIAPTWQMFIGLLGVILLFVSIQVFYLYDMNLSLRACERALIAFGLLLISLWTNMSYNAATDYQIDEKFLLAKIAISSIQFWIMAIVLIGVPLIHHIKKIYIQFLLYIVLFAVETVVFFIKTLHNRYYFVASIVIMLILAFISDVFSARIFGKYPNRFSENGTSNS
ncbi:MAG: hypothetical protein ACI4DK_05445 [Lachnospiraceae bacterium]